MVKKIDEVTGVTLDESYEYVAPESDSPFINSVNAALAGFVRPLVARAMDGVRLDRLRVVNMKMGEHSITSTSDTIYGSGAITVRSADNTNLVLRAGDGTDGTTGELHLADDFIEASSWTNPMKLAASSTEWTNLYTVLGSTEKSIVGTLYQILNDGVPTSSTIAETINNQDTSATGTLSDGTNGVTLTVDLDPGSGDTTSAVWKYVDGEGNDMFVLTGGISTGGGSFDVNAETVTVGDGTLTTGGVTVDGASFDVDATAITIGDAAASGTSSLLITTNAGDIDLTPAGIVDVTGALAASGSLKANDTGTAINIGVTAEQIDSAGALTIASGGSSDLTLTGANEIAFSDTNKSGSSYASTFLLSATSQDWSDFDTTFGEVSLLGAVGALGLTSNGDGASLIGIEDTAGKFDATDVEGALNELTLTTNGNGASIIGVEDSAGYFTGTNVEAVLAELYTGLQSAVNGLDWKDSVRLATVTDLDANTSISGSPAYSATGGTSGRGQITATLAVSDTFTVDGVSLGSADDGTRILLKNEATGNFTETDEANGIWVTTISGTSLTLDRATDFDADAKVTAGAAMNCEEGTANGNKFFVLTTNDPITIGGASGTGLTFGTFGSTTSHSALTNLSADDHTQYWLYTGRSGQSATMSTTTGTLTVAAAGAGTIQVAGGANDGTISGSDTTGRDLTIKSNDSNDGSIIIPGGNTLEVQVLTGNSAIVLGSGASAGDIVPATTGYGKVGTSALKFAEVNALTITSGDHVFNHPTNGGKYRMTEHPTDGLMIKNENTGKWYRVPMVECDAPDWEPVG